MRLAGIAIFVMLGGGVQDKDSARGEIDLRWGLPHDRAAVYDVFDPKTKKKRGEFWLLGCELSGKIGITEAMDLPYRYLFRGPRWKVKRGARWEIRELALSEVSGNWNLPPLEIVGHARLKEVRRARLEDLIPAAARGAREKSRPIEVAVIEGIYECTRYRWDLDKKKVVQAERKPSASFATWTVIRVSDGAVLGGRFRWKGRSDTYAGLSGMKTDKKVVGRELVFREPLVEMSRKALKTRIDRAIEAGVRWLKSKQGVDGKFMDRNGYPIATSSGSGSTGLVLQALLHSGTKRDEAVVRRGFVYCMSRPVNQSYDLGLQLMALEAKYLPIEKMEDLAHFSEERVREEIGRRITKADKIFAERAAWRLMEYQARSGGFGYTNNKDEITLSNTQYALLGLKSASRMGVKVPPSVWKRAFRYVERGAVRSGEEVDLTLNRLSGTSERRKVSAYAWCYVLGDTSDIIYSQETGTMTTAGLSGIAISRSELSRVGEWAESLGKRAEELELGGLAWLQKRFLVRASPPEGCWVLAAMPYFYLYSLERAGVLLEVSKLGGHDWYLEGTAILLSWQKEDGRWEGPHGTPIIDTAFALLFLKRATIPVETGRPKK